jgi:hypothetical protein
MGRDMTTRRLFHTAVAAFHAVVLAGILAATVPALAQQGPAPRSSNIAGDVLALACAPTMVYEAPATPLRITGGQDSFVRRIYRPGDLITINAGTDNGIEVGQQYYVRRVQRSGRGVMTRENPGVIHTAGWIRIYAVEDRNMALATITHACDTIESGDYLEPFALPEVAAASVAKGKTQHGNYGRILLGTDRRSSFGLGDFLIVDRGSDHGVMPGMRFVVYRDKQETGNFLYELGEVVAVDVKSETSTVKVTMSRDALSAGDYVAMRK